MLIVCTGGRDYEDHAMVDDVLNCLKPDRIFVGDALGADYWVRTYCDVHEVPYEIFDADWDTHGKKPGL